MNKKKLFFIDMSRVFFIVLVLLTCIAMALLIGRLLSNKSGKPVKKVLPVTIYSLPPPPPTPKQPEITPPEEQQKIELPQSPAEPTPQPLPDLPPEQEPARDSGLDAHGESGSDVFGLRAHQGGTGLFGGGGNPYAQYVGTIKNDILQLLNSHEELRHKDFTVTIMIWLNPDGTVDHFELGKEHRSPGIAEQLDKVLNQMTSLTPPPSGMPQPIRLRITLKV